LSPPAIPPYTPVPNGQTLTEVVASVITFEVTIDTTIENVAGAERRSAILSELASALECIVPDCHIDIIFTAGSLNIQVIVTVPEPSKGGMSTATSVIDSVNRFLEPEESPSHLAAIFGATVISRSTSPSVQNSVIVLIPAASPSPPESESPSVVLVAVGIGACLGIPVTIGIITWCCRGRRMKCCCIIRVRVSRGSARDSRGADLGPDNDRTRKKMPPEDGKEVICVAGVLVEVPPRD
jgi:hypothetical protein